MSIIVIILATVALFLISNLIANRIVYGPILKDNYIPDISTWELNGYSSGIITIDKGEFKWNFITNIPIPFIIKYHMHGHGQILIWSKDHKKIKERFKQLKQK